MIARLTGLLLESTLTDAILDVNGVGYRLLLPMSTVALLPSLGSKVTFHTYLAVREDAMTLYGFLTKEERMLFQLIVDNVKGFGPRLALSVLSTLSVSSVCSAVANQDVKLLSSISGVGKKSASQFLLDLKGKLDCLGNVAPVPTSSPTVASTTDSQVIQDAVSALETLGFRGADAKRVVDEIIAAEPDKKFTSEALIRRALGIMSGQK